MHARTVAALYDVHANLPALEAVLVEVDTLDVDAIVVGGDVVAGPMPRETLALLDGQDRAVVWVRGNSDRLRDFVGRTPPRPDLEWVAGQIDEARLDALAALPLDEVVEIDGLGATHFCHGAPGSDMIVIAAATVLEDATRPWRMVH